MSFYYFSQNCFVIYETLWGKRNPDFFLSKIRLFFLENLIFFENPIFFIENPICFFSKILIFFENIRNLGGCPCTYTTFLKHTKSGVWSLSEFPCFIVYAAHNIPSISDAAVACIADIQPSALGTGCHPGSETSVGLPGQQKLYVRRSHMRPEPHHDELHTFRSETEPRRHCRNEGWIRAVAESHCRHDMMNI